MTAKQYLRQTLDCKDGKQACAKEHDYTSEEYGMKEPMTGEQFLNSIRYLDNEIDALDHERVRLSSQRQDILDKAENLASPLNGVRVQQGLSNRTEALGLELASAPDVTSLVRRLNSYQQRINRKIDELVDRKQKALDVIEDIPDARYRTLLTLRFLSNLQWSTIADMMGYTDAYVRLSLKDESISEFERFLKQPS